MYVSSFRPALMPAMAFLTAAVAFAAAAAPPSGAAARNAALQQAVWTDAPGTAGAVLRALRDPDLGVRQIALANAALASDQPDLAPLLLRAAATEGPSARWLAVRAVAGLPPVLTSVPATVRAWASDPDPLIRRALLANVAPGPGVAALMAPCLTRALLGSDVGDRMAGADGWARLRLAPTSEIISVLERDLASENEATAGGAGYALNALWNPPVEQALAALTRSPSLEQRVRAADLLRRRGIGFELSIYGAVFEHGDEATQLYACGTLGRLSSGGAATVLGAGAGSTYASVRQAAVYALESNGSKAAFDILMRLLRRGDNLGRYRAAVVLGRTWPEQARRALAAAARSDPDPEVRKAAGFAAATDYADVLPAMADLPRADPGALRVPDCAGRPTLVQGGVVLVGSQKQLLVDDLSLASLGGAVRVFHRFHKDPRNPILEQQLPWEYDGTTVFFTSIDYDATDHRLRLYYDSDMADPTPMSERGAPPSKRFQLAGRTQMVAFSTDGIHWIRPNVGRFPTPDGSRTNNLVGSANNVIALAPPYRGRYRYATYWPVAYRGAQGMTVSFSVDGIGGWTEQREVAQQGGDVDSMARDRIAGGYLGYTKWRRLWWLGQSFGDRYSPLEARFLHAVRLATAGGRSFAPDYGLAPDHFERGPIDLLPHAIDDRAAPEEVAESFPGLDYFSVGQMHAEIYQITSFPYEGVCFALPSVFVISGRRVSAHNEDGLINLSLMFSRDPLAGGWRTNADGRLAPVLDLGRWGEWDSVRCYGPNRLIVVNDRIVLYYTGYSHGHDSRNYRYGPPGPDCPGEPYYRAAVGRATMRLDGFASLHAGMAGAAILTRPLRFHGNQLQVNVRGRISAEILDRDGRAIPGFGRGQCVPFAGDALRQPLTWKGSDLGRLEGRVVRVRFFLTNGDLYAYRFVERRTPH